MTLSRPPTNSACLHHGTKIDDCCLGSDGHPEDYSCNGSNLFSSYYDEGCSQRYRMNCTPACLDNGVFDAESCANPVTASCMRNSTCRAVHGHLYFRDYIYAEGAVGCGAEGEVETKCKQTCPEGVAMEHYYSPCCSAECKAGWEYFEGIVCQTSTPHHFPVCTRP